ncbi:alpha/beta hydrolase [uncultured Pontibacter sp.]|uniref:alpha/beta fold hydrolase n=1 Tax=uncultured Pontibacter sp. TaxID=453356 RepID=UPI0026282814|nr:alpha/beta hydrolase [uncultured Pontibacter sp.]
MPHTTLNFKENFVQLDNVTLKLKWINSAPEGAADRPILVFLHDSLGCIKLWRDFPEKLAMATGCTALVYDRQGYGESAPFTTLKRDHDYLEREADVLHNLLEQQQVKSAILFGHSDGGSIALLAAAKYSKLITGVITEGAHVFVEDVTLAGIRLAVAAYKETNLREKLMKYHQDKTDDVFNAWTETWLSEGYRNWNIELFLPALFCPVLVIQGEADEYGTLAQVEDIVQQVQGPANQLIIPKIGHTPHREAEVDVLQHSTDFINRLR